MSWADELPPLALYDEYVEFELPAPRPSTASDMALPAGVDGLPEPEAPRPPLLRHVRELLTNPPAVRWLVHGIIEADTLALLYGQPGAGKSFIALSMAASLACGVDWYDHRVTQGPTIYLLGEGGGGVSRRLRAWQLSNPDARLQDAPLYVSSRMVPLGESKAVEEIAAAIEESGAGKPSSVWIDTLARAAAGLDENSSRDMGELIKACDAIRERYGCAVVLVHHAGHNQDRARGSSAIKAALDTEMSAAKDGQIITLASTKSKESEPFRPLTFQLTGVDTGWNDEDGEHVYSAVLEPCDAPEQEQGEVLGKNQTVCLRVLKEMYANRRANLEQGGRSPDDARVTLAEWRESSGLIRQR
ncbi:MAG: AAA family ATPase, partial [Acidithiobacillus sp.]